MRLNLTMGHYYIIIITIAWCILFWRHLSLRDKQQTLMKKNKFKYDLREITFEILVKDDESMTLNFFRGDKVLFSRKVTDADLFNDRNYAYKTFVAWLEVEE